MYVYHLPFRRKVGDVDRDVVAYDEPGVLVVVIGFIEYIRSSGA
jgi:hypothetical protein